MSLPALETLLQPISTAAPAGENAAYDPEHEAIRREVAKLESPSGSDVDWKLIATTGSAMLQTRSKDILIACYVAAAWFELEGLAGLARGTELLSGLSAEYWDSMYPPARRARARGNAMTWLIDRVGPALAESKLEAADAKVLLALESAVTSLGATTRAKDPEHAPPLRPLTDAIARLKMSLPPGSVASAATPSVELAPASSPVAPASEPASEAQPTNPNPSPAQSSPEPATASQPAPAPAPAPAPPPPPPKPVVEEKKDPVDELAKKWLQEISAEQPSGPDLRYEPEYGEVKKEITKLESITPGDVNWKVIDSGASELLESKTKDLLLASWWARARHKQAGIHGLAQGLALLVGLHAKFWNSMHPPVNKVRRRANAVTWYLEQVEAELQAFTPKPVDREPLLLAEQAAKRLAAQVRERYEQGGPAMRPLLDGLGRALMSVPAPKPKADPKPEPAPVAAASAAAPAAAAPVAQAAAAPAAPAALAGALPGAPAAAPASPEAAVDFMRQTGEALQKVGTMLREASAASAAGYRLTILGLFLHMDAAPPASGTQTKIPAVPSKDLERLGLMAQNSKWEPLLDETMALLRRHRFALDLHRRAAEALEQLGHKQAKDSLIAELSAVLVRMPELSGYQAGDGSPLADEDTRAWLSSAVLGGGGGGEAAGGGASEVSPRESARREAVAQAGSGKLVEALAGLSDLVTSAPTDRERFDLQLDVAAALAKAGKARLSLAMHHALVDESERMGLARWEPELTARALGGLVNSRKAAAKANVPVNNRDAVLEALVVLDPKRALELG